MVDRVILMALVLIPKTVSMGNEDGSGHRFQEKYLIMEQVL